MAGHAAQHQQRRRWQVGFAWKASSFSSLLVCAPGRAEPPRAAVAKLQTRALHQGHALHSTKHELRDTRPALHFKWIFSKIDKNNADFPTVIRVNCAWAV